MTTSNLKTPLRNKIKQQRAQLTANFVQHQSLLIQRQLYKLGPLKSATKIGFYMPFKGEVDPGYYVNQAMGHLKKFYLPVIQANGKLSFVKVDRQSQLVQNKYGILEPSQLSACIETYLLDAILCPLVGFDGYGHRLGMGAGYYDKTLAFKQHPNQKPLLIGLAYDFQFFSYIPNNYRDVSLNYCLTPTRTFDFT